MSTRWTPVQEAYLRRNWTRSSTAEIAWVLGYTADQVRDKAKRMKLRRGPKRHTWTTEEDARLRRAFPDTPTRSIAQAMGMTECQIQARARKLGLAKSPAHQARMAHAQSEATAPLAIAAFCFSEGSRGGRGAASKRPDLRLSKDTR